MRCFIAITIPDAVKQSLARLGAQLRQCPVSASWAQPDRAHLTLRFLGDITPDQAASIDAILRHRLIGTRPFNLMVHGAGAFPTIRRPKIVWAGVVPIDGPLTQVQQHCEEAAKAVGLPPEEKAFFPHITLARVKGRKAPPELMPAIERERAFAAGEFTVSSVGLFRSELTRRGPEYTRLQEYRFS